MKEVLSRIPCNHKHWACLAVEPKASFNCTVFPLLISNGRHSHLRTLEADIKGQILPPIFRLTSETLMVTLWHSRGLVVLWSETCNVQGRQDQKQGITAPGKGMLLDF